MELTNGYTAGLLVLASLVILGIYARPDSRERATERMPMTELGGIKLNGFEVIVGSVLSVTLVVCVVLYGSLVDEASQVQAAKLLGAWQIGSGSDGQVNESAIIEWLMEGEQQFDDEPILDTRIQMAVSLLDQHKVTQHGFRIADTVIHAVLWFIVIATSLQVLLISQNLNGLRVLLPAVFVSLIVLMSYLSPSISEMPRLIGSGPITISLKGSVP